MKESMSDMLLEELSKGVYKVKASLKKRSSFKTPEVKFKYGHDHDSINVGTSFKFKNTVSNSKQVFHIAVILKDIIRKRLRG
jgi:hypothetical protein